MEVCVIGGAGYVGLVTGACLASLGHSVRCVDTDQERIEGLCAGRLPFYEEGLPELISASRAAGRLTFTTRIEEGMAGARVALLCVGTPAATDGSPNLSHVLQAVESVQPYLAHCSVLAVKSTVPPGTARRLEGFLYQGAESGCAVASCPEFLREGSAVTDFLRPDRVVFGVRTRAAQEVLEALHLSIEAPRLVTTPENAEMVKYAANVLLAAKVSLANELAEICERVGADVLEVVRGIGFDRRIGSAFLQPGLGFGGPCLEKDLKALIHTAGEHGYSPALLRAVEAVNATRVQVILNKVRSLVGALEGRSIGVVGLAFKAGTSDVRDSRALALIAALRAEGAEVAGYDPHAAQAAQRVLPWLKCAASVLELAGGAECLVIATEWEEFGQLDWAAVARRMRRPCLVDARNRLDPRAITALGFHYEGVGRPTAAVIQWAAGKA